jgi:cytochrome c6
MRGQEGGERTSKISGDQLESVFRHPSPRRHSIGGSYPTMRHGTRRRCSRALPVAERQWCLHRTPTFLLTVTRKTHLECQMHASVQWKCKRNTFVWRCENMSARLLARIFAILIFLATAAWPGFAQPADTSAASTYKTTCVACHGPDGRGSTVGKSLHAADFHSAQVQQQSDSQLATAISDGRGNMPAFGTRMSQDQINSLVKYIRTLGKAK